MNDDLSHWGPIMVAVTAKQANDQILDYLAPLDRPLFNSRLRRLDRALAIKAKGKNKKGQDNRARKGDLVGRLFEELLHVLFVKGGAVTISSRVRTTTNEIDLLLAVDPLGAHWVPMLAEAGTHALGEAKCHAKPPSSALTDEFVGMLRKHNAKLGILFVNCKSRDLDSRARVSISLHWKDGFQIVPIGRKQLMEVQAGANFLRVLRDQHIQAKTFSTKLAI